MLTRLVTVVLARIGETDEVWCRELLQGQKAERDAKQTHGDTSLNNAYEYAIAIVERAIGSDEG